MMSRDSPSEDKFYQKLDDALCEMEDEAHRLNISRWKQGEYVFKVVRKQPDLIDVELNIEQGKNDYGFVEYGYGFASGNLEHELRRDSKRKGSGLKNITKGTVRYYPRGQYDLDSENTLGSYNWNLGVITQDSPLIEIIYPNDNMRSEKKNNVLIRPTIDWTPLESDESEAKYDGLYFGLSGTEKFGAEPSKNSDKGCWLCNTYTDMDDVSVGKVSKGLIGELRKVAIPDDLEPHSLDQVLSSRKAETFNADRNELSEERTELAHQRTNLAWVRTGLAIVGFGAAIWAIQKGMEK